MGGERVPETQEKKIVLGTTPLFTHTHTLTHISTHIPKRVSKSAHGRSVCVLACSMGVFNIPLAIPSLFLSLARALSLAGGRGGPKAG